MGVEGARQAQMKHQAVVQLFYNPASGSFSPARIAALAAAFEAEGARVVRSESVREVPVLEDGATTSASPAAMARSGTWR